MDTKVLLSHTQRAQGIGLFDLSPLPNATGTVGKRKYLSHRSD